MTVQETYKRFLIKVNKNDSQANVRITEPLFILIFNEQLLIWFSEIIEKSLNSDAIDDIQEFIETIEIDSIDEKNNKSYFLLPDNFFKYINAQAEATTKTCTRLLYIYKFKPKNKNVYLQDEFRKPSFEWEETLADLTKKHIIVYTDEFSVKKLYLDYYKLPEFIDIEGYVTINGEMSKTVHPTLSNEFVNQVINRCVSEYSKITENSETYQLAETRLLKEI